MQDLEDFNTKMNVSETFFQSIVEKINEENLFSMLDYFFGSKFFIEVELKDVKDTTFFTLVRERYNEIYRKSLDQMDDPVYVFHELTKKSWQRRRRADNQAKCASKFQPSKQELVKARIDATRDAIARSKNHLKRRKAR